MKKRERCGPPILSNVPVEIIRLAAASRAHHLNEVKPGRRDDGEGAGALLTGIGPTLAGYFLQGGLKFGGYEFFKQQSINVIGYENARNNRIAVYCVSGAAAEFFADIALCPLEATRIRLVSEPGFAKGLVPGFTKIARQEGLAAFYSGFGPILFKQWVPSTFSPCP